MMPVLSTATAPRPPAPRTPARWTAAAGLGGAVVAALAGILAGFGWLYLLRGLGWFAVGPRIGETLPLLQLAGADVQPLLRVAVAWLLAGVLVGAVMVRVPPWRRSLTVGLVALIVLLLAAQAAYSLTRNVPLSSVILSHAPGAGPAIEAALLALGCALPRTRSLSRGERSRLRGARLPARLAGLGERGLGGGEHGHARQDDGDRHHVGDDDPGV